MVNSYLSMLDSFKSNIKLVIDAYEISSNEENGFVGKRYLVG